VEIHPRIQYSLWTVFLSSAVVLKFVHVLESPGKLKNCRCQVHSQNSHLIGLGCSQLFLRVLQLGEGAMKLENYCLETVKGASGTSTKWELARNKI
jgi:hypothetical protein